MTRNWQEVAFFIFFSHRVAAAYRTKSHVIAAVIQRIGRIDITFTEHSFHVFKSYSAFAVSLRHHCMSYITESVNVSHWSVFEVNLAVDLSVEAFCEERRMGHWYLVHYTLTICSADSKFRLCLCCYTILKCYPRISPAACLMCFLFLLQCLSSCYSECEMLVCSLPTL